MPDASYEKIRHKLSHAAGGELERKELLWVVAEIGASVLEGTGALEGAAMLVGAPFAGLEALMRKKEAMTPNPWFIWNGHDDHPSKFTKDYLEKRRLLKNIATAMKFSGAALSTVTVVNLNTVIGNTSSLGATGVHIYQLRSIAQSYDRSKTLMSWIDLVIQTKVAKGLVRGAQLGGAVVSLGPVGSAVAEIVVAAAKAGVRARFGNICGMLAMDLHWRAYAEQNLLRNLGGGSSPAAMMQGRNLGDVKGGTGPATRILRELFTQRGISRLTGKHEIDQMILEPCGWMAIHDLLLLI